VAIDLFELRAYTAGVDIDDLRLVHLPAAGGGPDWGLMRTDGGRLTRWLSLDAEDRGDAVRIIEAVGLMPLRDEAPAGDEQDVVVTLQPGSEKTPDETPV
jgi:hypothetical protein